MKKLLVGILILSMIVPACCTASTLDNETEFTKAMIVEYAKMFGVEGTGNYISIDEGKLYMAYTESGITYGVSLEDEKIKSVFVRCGTKENTYDFLSMCLAVSMAYMGNYNQGITADLLMGYLTFAKEGQSPFIENGYYGTFYEQDDGIMYLLMKGR